jgi:hypothetical protein
MYFTRNYDGPSIEEVIKHRNSFSKEHWKVMINLSLQGDATIWWNSLNYRKMMALSDEEFEKVFLEKWSHAKSKERRKGYFHVEILYYRFMDVFIKKISLFLLTLVACIILSMFSWLIDCKFLQRMFKAHRLRVKMFKFLKI